MADVPTYWAGSRVHQGLTVKDGDTVLAVFETFVAPYPQSPVPGSTWAAAATYAGAPGVWLDGLTPGTYRIWARYGPGNPDERPIVLCGYVNIRG